MIELTDRAQKHLDEYLGEVRTSLAACPSVDRVDVERDVREHIDKSLCETAPPVDLADLTRVLDALGSPAQWVPEEELSWSRKLRLGARRVLKRLWSGPEDFRLAYLSIGLLGLAALLFCGDPDGPLVLICIALSFLFARASLAAASNPEELGAQRWLLYPVLVLVYVPVALGLLFWPVVLGVNLADELFEEMESFGQFPFPVLAVHWAITCTAFWWFVLGLVFWAWPGLVRGTFYPFIGGFRRGHALVFTAFALVVLVVAVGLGVVGLSEGPNALRILGG